MADDLVRGRVCAVCGKRGGATYGFKTKLQFAGHPNWRHDKAHPRCVTKWINDEGERRATEEDNFRRYGNKDEQDGR